MALEQIGSKTAIIPSGGARETAKKDPRYKGISADLARFNYNISIIANYIESQSSEKPPNPVVDQNA